MNDDLPFFNAVLDIAKTCGASYGNINTIDCDSSVTTSCTSGFKSTNCNGITVGTGGGDTVSNGFVGKSQAQMKADVAARPASNVPPAPDAPAAATKGAKKIQVDIRLKDATGFLGDSTAAKAKRTELETNLAKALCNECATPPFKVKLVAVSKGSTIVTAEVQPAEGSSEISAADVDTINDEMEQTGGLGKSPSMTAYGNLTATIPAPAPPGQAPAPVRDAKKIALPKGLNTPPAKLPAAVTGIPRTGIDGSSYEGGFEIDNSKYLESLAGQMLPGIVMAVLLFVIMILMLLVYLVSTLCGLTFCKCCNGAYKPRRFSKKDLKINKVVCLVFCAITAAGAFAVFAETPPLLENTKDLTGAMAGTISELSANVTAIADAMEAAAADPTLAIGDIASTTKTMKDAMASVDKTVQDAQDQIEEYVDMTGLYVTAAGIMFGITFIVFALGFVGFWRLLIFFTIILSIMMIIGWIVWGLLSLLTVFVDDLCWAMNDYLRDRYNSDLSDFIPCMDPKVAVSTMNVARDQVASGIAAVNDQLEEYSGGESGNPYLKYLCYNYAKVPLKDLCTKETIYHDQAYSTFVCQAEDQKKLTEKADMTSYDSTIQDLIMFPDAFCPYPTNFYSVALGNFSKPASDGGLGQLRCPFKGYSDDAMTQANEFSMGQCYTVKQLPSDVFDAKAATAEKAQLVLDVMPKIESLLQCELVATAFSRMVGPCEGMATALTSLYAGFLLVAMGYFLLWASTLVLISRLQYYRSYCVDADKY